jgi:hypothetical protein
MRTGVQQKRSPIVEGFEKLREHPSSQSDYSPTQFGAEIGRNPSVNFPGFDKDSNAAYQCALMAAITADERYAATSRKIVLGWAASLERVSGADAVLMAGLGPFKLINAAEILRASGALDAAGAAQFAAMLHRAILPTIIDFAPFANGNWDTAAIKTMLAIAVFCDDRPLFDRALMYYMNGDGDGRITNYIYASGQCQESGRDQQHTQLGLAHMDDACEVAWNQGLDLYGAVENRLLRGFEYTAAYNLGDTVEFKPDVDRTGKYRHPAISLRSAFRPVYEQIFAHYHVRRGLDTPAVARAVEKVRPEGSSQGADHTGFGTLLYALQRSDVSPKANAAAPAALHAEMKDGAVELNWLAPRTAHDFFIERADESGSFRRINSVSGVETFRDHTVKRGKKYHYRIIAQSAGMQGLSSAPATIVAGLPSGWIEAQLGSPLMPGSAQFDGEMLTVRAGGAALLGSADEGQFIAAAPDCVSLHARFQPQTASQVAMFGLACRMGLAANAPCAALLILPLAGDLERHGWHIQIVTRNRDGVAKTLFDSPFEPSVAPYGRLINPVWLRLERKQSSIVAQFSTDGAEWKDAGQAPDFEGGRMGFIACSGIPEVDAAVRFDSIHVAQR